MAVAEKAVPTQQRIEDAEARVEALKAEAEGVGEAIKQALRDGDKDRYLDLMIRENQIPHEQAEAETTIRTLSRQALQERYDAVVATLPGLRKTYEDIYHRNQEQIKALEAEEEEAHRASYVANQEALQLQQQIQALGAATQ